MVERDSSERVSNEGVSSRDELYNQHKSTTRRRAESNQLVAQDSKLCIEALMPQSLLSNPRSVSVRGSHSSVANTSRLPPRKIRTTTTATTTTTMASSKMMSTMMRQSRRITSHQRMSCLFTLTTLSFAILNHLHQPIECAASGSTVGSSPMANRLAERTKHLVDLGRSSGGQLGDWLVHQVAPVVATKLIDNVLQKPASQSGSKTRNAKSTDLPIDTQALADKIVDKLADSIKKKSAGTPPKAPADHSEQTGRSVAAASESLPQTDDQQTAAKGSQRRGKSLVSDSVQQVMQNLFSRDPQRTFLGRAMEKHAKMANGLSHHHSHHHQTSSQQQQHRPSSASSTSWMMVKEPVYEPHLFVSTDSSQLDDNPVVLRAEHGHNLTTMSPPKNQYVPPTRDSLYNKQQALYQKQKYQQQQQQQKLSSVHSNRHNQQQQLAPKPWSQHQPQIGRRPQQSPYSLPTVTSDMNIVQAPSSPPPPPITTSTQPTTTTSTSTTTTSLPPMRDSQTGSSSYLAPTHHQITHLGANKFKINNRHQAPPSSVAISPNSWFSSNHNSRYQHHHNRYPMPGQSSTTTTTTSTTTSTTTPMPEPQTEPLMPTEMINGMESSLLSNDLDPQTSAPVSSILSSVAQTALDALGSTSLSAISTGQSDDSYSSSSSNSYQHATQYNSSSSISNGGAQSHSYQSHTSSSLPTKGGAMPSTTTARHSILSSEAIPTALGAPLYHLTRANFTTHSLMGPLPSPPRRSGAAAPAAKAVAQYLQKSMNSLSSTIFSRQSKGWARRLGLSSVLLSGLLYGAAVLSNPGAPLPSNGLEVLQALSKGAKKRRGGGSSTSPLANVPALVNGVGLDQFASSTSNQNSNNVGDIDRITTNTAALLDNNVQLLYQQQPQLIAIIEHLIQQEQQQLLQRQQQNSHFAQRSGSSADYVNSASSPIEIFNVQDSDEVPNYYTSISPSFNDNRLHSIQEQHSTQNSSH